MTVRHFILATAGHIDHGKSSLVHKLTGTDPDRLPEEKSRGMTIDLGFASFVPDPTLSIGIVDVPGHEDFVKNMVAGVGAVDAALLVVAADDGWMQQTEEHLQILQHLDVRHGLVALSKADRIHPDELKGVINRVRTRLTGTFLAHAPIVPTSIHSSGGLDELRTQIIAIFNDITVSLDIGKPRLQIDRSFLLRGIGRIVTGTLNGGSFSRGQSVTLTPSMVVSRVRVIHSHNRDLLAAHPGMRVAMNLPDLPATGDWRGQTLTLESLATPHDVIDVLLHQSERLHNPRPLKRNLVIGVHHGTQLVPARLIPFQNNQYAQLRLKSPLTTFTGDRLVLRDAAQRHTIAGATVLDPSARRSGMQHAERLAYLVACSTGINDVESIISAIVTYRQFVRRADLLLQSRFSDAAIDAAIERLKIADRVVCRNGFIVLPAKWAGVLSKLAEKIVAFHEAQPEQLGMPIAALRRIVETEFASNDLFDSIIDEMVSRGFTHLQNAIRHRNHRPRLPARLQSAGNSMRSTLAARRLDPPSRNELAPDSIALQALAFLKTTGEAVQLSPQVVISSEAYITAVESVREFLTIRKFATVTELKTAMGTSRRVAVPLLEKLDQIGVTRRDGDLRRLR